MNATTATMIATRTMSVQHRPFVRAELFVNLQDAARQSDDNAGKNDQRHAVTDAAIGDLLAEPHDESRSGRQRQHGHQDEPDTRD